MCRGGGRGSLCGGFAKGSGREMEEVEESAFGVRE